MLSSTFARLFRTSTGLQRVVGVSTMRVEAKKGSKAAGKAVAKSDLPSKICLVCKRPFTWYISTQTATSLLPNNQGLPVVELQAQMRG